MFYRFSRVFQDGLVRNPLSVLRQVSPSPQALMETKSSLDFAARAKKVRNAVKRNLIKSPEEQNKFLCQQILALKRQVTESARAHSYY